MNLDNIDQKIFNDLFRKLSKKASVYINSSVSKSDNFDPFRNTGYDTSLQNPLTVKILPSTVAPGALVFREMGLVSAGALNIVVKNNDVDLIKNAAKITIDGDEYYVYDDAVGGKFQIFPTKWSKYSKITIFRKNADNLFSGGNKGTTSLGHTHKESDITDLDKYTQSEVDALLAQKADLSHTHSSSEITDFSEAVDDRVANLVQNTTGLTWSYNDPGNSLELNLDLSSFSISDLGTTDHDLLSGLGDDDHTQYALLSGRDGDILVIDQVKAFDTEGLKLYDKDGNGIFVKDGGQVGIGTNSPDRLLRVDGDSYFQRLYGGTSNVMTHRFYAAYIPSGSPSGNHRGVTSEMFYNSNTQFLNGEVTGVYGVGDVFSDGKVNQVQGILGVAKYRGAGADDGTMSLYGGRFSSSIIGSGHAEHMVGIKLDTPNVSGATAQIFGLYIDNQTPVGGGTLQGNQSAIHIEGLDPISWSADNGSAHNITLTPYSTDILALEGANFGIGMTSPTGLLHLASGTATKAPLKLNSGTLLTTPETGSIEFDGESLSFTPVADRRKISLTSGSITSDTTVSNTVTETTVYTESISANELHVGQVISAKISGIFSTANASDTFTARLKIGGTTVDTFTSTADNVTNGGFLIEFNGTIRSTGANGSIIAEAVGFFNNELKQSVNSSTTIIDTTASSDITLTIEWDNADVGNTFTVQQGLSTFES